MAKVSIITPIWCDISDKVNWLSEMIQSVQRCNMLVIAGLGGLRTPQTTARQ
jgi:hypothetical protein